MRAVPYDTSEAVLLCPPCCAGLDGYSESMTARRGDLRGPVTKPVPTAVIRQRPR